MYLGLDIGSLPPLFGGELPEVNSDDQIDVVLPQLQREIDSTLSISKPLSNYTIAKAENNSNRIDESVLKEDFYKTLDKKCREKHHQNFEELSKQSLKNALEIQGEVYQDFIKEKVKLSEEQLVYSDRHEYPCIVTDCLFTTKYRAHLDRHFFKHIKVSPHYCEQCLPNIFFARDKTDLDKHKRRIHRLDKVTPKCSIKRIHEPDRNTIVENNSNRIDESVLKEDFYKTLDKKCQEEHHQNFEELSEQSLKNALDFQGEVYEDFTEKKVIFFEKQLVPSDRYEYPCVVTDCSFTNERKVIIKRHLFQHIKVSPYYCEQCLPHTFFVRDTANLNRHIRHKHSTDSTLSKYGAKRICPPDQNTMNGSSGFTVNQESDPCLLLNSAKRAKTDP